jgi:hypothetical protein
VATSAHQHFIEERLVIKDTEHFASVRVEADYFAPVKLEFLVLDTGTIPSFHTSSI